MEWDLPVQKKQGNLRQQGSQLSEACFKLKDLGYGVQNDNAYKIAIDWGMSQANQNSDKGSLAACHYMSKKASHLSVCEATGGSSSFPLGKPREFSAPFSSLKCWNTNTRSMKNEQEKLEIRVWLQGNCDHTVITEIQWEILHNWNVVMESHVLFRKDIPASENVDFSLCERTPGVYQDLLKLNGEPVCEN